MHSSADDWSGRKARDDNGAQNLVAVGKSLDMKKGSVCDIKAASADYDSTR